MRVYRLIAEGTDIEGKDAKFQSDGRFGVDESSMMRKTKIL